MSLFIAGSIATDHLMTYSGKFQEALVAEQLDKLSVSFLVDDLEIRRGGVGANIAFGLAQLGLRPVLVGAAGVDFADYRSWLERHGVDCGSVRVSESLHTARFVCTTDSTMAQVASFYPGAMAEARLIELAPIAERVGVPKFVLIGADDPQAMLRHTEECRQRGYAFIADPSQQLSSSEPAFIRSLIQGATFLFSNEYEAHMIGAKTGWSSSQILELVEIQVTTLGANGVRIQQRGGPIVEVPALSVDAIEPTGVGDAFRAGFLAALSWGVGLEAAAQTGSTLASFVVETVGTQEYEFSPDQFVERLQAGYGSDVADLLRPHILEVGN